MLKGYWNYFKYIVQHKWYVAIECAKKGMFLHALTHDLSKFRPSEFFPYQDKFFSGDYAYRFQEVEENFKSAWVLHQHRNKHHWGYWVDTDGIPVPMPARYIKQMLADWNAMGRKFGVQATEFYLKNRDNMILHDTTRAVIDAALKLYQ